MSAVARDIVAQASLPTHTAKHAEPLPDLLPGQRRLVLGAEGLFLQARSHALHVSVPLAAFPTPYAPVDAFVRGTHGPIPAHIWNGLVDAALDAHPKEMARLVVSGPDGYHLIDPPVSSAGAGHVTFDESAIAEGSLLLDAHSHGAGRSYFSGTDDASDLSRPGLHLSCVFGRCGARDRVEVCLRLCAAPYLLNLPVSVLGAL